MRRLCLTLLCGLVAVPAALAATHATGDGVLELKAATGTIILTGSRGTAWGQMDKGKLVVTDPALGDGAIYVSGAETVTPGRTEAVTIYTGRDIHFRVTGGRYKLAFRGAASDLSAVGVDLTAVGVGSVQLTGDAFADDTGKWAVDSGKWNTVPVWTVTKQFGVQPAPAP
ncbi:MAG: hypothetical protein ACJ757_15775 [Gaiellaceae bacterium]